MRSTPVGEQEPYSRGAETSTSLLLGALGLCCTIRSKAFAVQNPECVSEERGEPVAFGLFVHRHTFGLADIGAHDFRHFTSDGTRLKGHFATMERIGKPLGIRLAQGDLNTCAFYLPLHAGFASTCIDPSTFERLALPIGLHDRELLLLLSSLHASKSYP